jgi:ferrous iron transport protein B
VAIILNATQIDRQISLAIQLQHLQLPTVLLLNMADEAATFGHDGIDQTWWTQRYK